jgi:dipeptidyl aminopeptidase/acylaminoacyl peptidase
MNTNRAFLFGLLATLGATGQSAALPNDELLRADDAAAVEISPDGQYFAVSRMVDGATVIAFHKLPSMQGVRGVKIEPGLRVSQLAWASNDRLVYTVTETGESNDTPLATDSIYALDRASGEPVAIYGVATLGNSLSDTWTPVAPQIVDTLPGDDRLILITEYKVKRHRNRLIADPAGKPALSTLDVVSGVRNSIEQLPVAQPWIATDDSLHARLVAGRDARGEQVVLVKRASEWQPIEVASFADGTIEPQRLSADGRTLYFLAKDKGASVNALYKLDVESKTTEKLYGDAQSPIERVVYDLSGDAIIGVKLAASPSSYHWLDEKHPAVRLYQMVERAFPGQAAEITSASGDSRYAVALVSSDTNPGDYYLIDTQTRKADFLMPTRGSAEQAAKASP